MFQSYLVNLPQEYIFLFSAFKIIKKLIKLLKYKIKLKNKIKLLKNLLYKNNKKMNIQINVIYFYNILADFLPFATCNYIYRRFTRFEIAR